MIRDYDVIAKIKRNWPLWVILGIWIVVFYQLYGGQSVVGFRDSAYLYYPYFQWIDQQWQNGEMPLWNPYCDIGYPVVADGTSSIWYPGKLIFLFRKFSYPARYGMYLSVHVLWAAATAYLLARRLRASPMGAGVAGFSYAFGGVVLFQITNVVYLVSAAWLPLGLHFVLNIAKRQSACRIIVASVAASMMILGGDPQMAYVLGVIGVVHLFVHLFVRRKRYPSWNLWRTTLGRGGRSMAIFAGLTMMLSAAQVVPSFFWSQQSQRVSEHLSALEKSLEPTPGTHLHAIYEFSQPPWTVGELFWPNISGKPFPIHCRWTDAFPGADRIWSPSIYVGFLTVFLACGASRFYGLSRTRIGLTWLALVFGFASFGWYGPVWLVHEILLFWNIELTGTGNSVGSQVGGFYWLSTVLLPEFDAFRYPAKLLTVASLAISVLAGVGFDDKWLNWRSTLFLFVIVLGTMAIWISLNSIGEYLMDCNESNANVLYGPFELLGWQSRFTTSLYHTALMATIVGATAVVQQSTKRFRNLTEAVVFVLLIGDLLVANSWLRCEVDVSVFTDSIKIPAIIESMDVNGTNPRLVRDVVLPATFRRNSSPNRLAEIITWQRESLHPKHHLSLAADYGIEICGSFTSIEHRLAQVWRDQARKNLKRGETNAVLNGRLVWDASSMEPQIRIQSPSTTKFRLVTPEVALTELGVYEEPEASDGSLRLLEQRPSRIKLLSDTDHTATVLINVYPDPGWQVRVLNAAEEIVNDKKRSAGDFHLAVNVPAGRHTVLFEYCPPEIWQGLVVSSTSWLLTMLVWLVLRLSKTTRQQ